MIMISLTRRSLLNLTDISYYGEIKYGIMFINQMMDKVKYSSFSNDQKQGSYLKLKMPDDKNC